MFVFYQKMKLIHSLWLKVQIMWFSANAEVAAETVSHLGWVGVPGFGGVLIYRSSSSTRQPALLPYDPSAFSLLLPFFSAACFRHISDAKWWVAFSNTTGWSDLYRVLLCDLLRLTGRVTWNWWNFEVPCPNFNCMCKKWANSVKPGCVHTWSVRCLLDVSLRRWFAEWDDSCVWKSLFKVWFSLQNGGSFVPARNLFWESPLGRSFLC